jgi:ceramide synthetase
MVIFVHDITDIFLEFAKCNIYLKNRNGKFYIFHERLATLGFALFTCSWYMSNCMTSKHIKAFEFKIAKTYLLRYLFRLYWFPLRILYATGVVAIDRLCTARGAGLWAFFNTLLWILLVLNIYWFYVS